MNASVKSFLASMPKSKWNYVLRNKPDPFDFSPFTERFGSLPKSFQQFVTGFETVRAKDLKTWFLCGDDYRNKYAFKWDEMELLSLDARTDYPELVEKEKAAWRMRLPITFAFRSGYAVFCLKFKDGIPGQVVLLEEPMFEDETVVAESYDEYLETFFTKVKKNKHVKLVL